MADRFEPDGPQACRNCGAPLTPGASFCAECGASQRVATPLPRTTRPSGRPWWVPVAIGVGALSAVIGGALLGLAVIGDRTAGGPTPTPSGSAAATSSSGASESAAPSESATPSPSPTPATAAVIPNRAIASIAVDALELRAAASASAEVRTTLGPEQRLFVIGEPTESDDLRWYRVAVVADDSCGDDCGRIGFVGTPIAEADEPTIEAAEVECPSSPLTRAGEDVPDLAPLEALHCYGRNDIVIEGIVEYPCCSPPTPFDYTPEWLASPHTPAFLQNRFFAIAFRPHPDADLEVPERGDVVRVTGHFEDPAATSCRATVNEEVAGEDEVTPPDPAGVILDCRATFVWTAYEVIGHEDLGPCCGWDPSRAGSTASASWRRLAA